MLWMVPVLAALAQAASPALTLEIRVFLGAQEVSTESRVTVHRAGQRGAAISSSQGHQGRHVFTVPAGIYDAQIVRERDGRVVNIRWAERLIVMPYPDEGGRHLEVVNFTNGYGALQVRIHRDGGTPDVALFAAGDRTNAIAPMMGAREDSYALFIVPAGRYDLEIKKGSRSSWQPDLEIPLDRTRLWVLQ